jgi:hypothetical protein
MLIHLKVMLCTLIYVIAFDNILSYLVNFFTEHYSLQIIVVLLLGFASYCLPSAQGNALLTLKCLTIFTYLEMR